jgi:pimeloyl-ACP methyl ester carboxylesterase
MTTHETKIPWPEISQHSIQTDRLTVAYLQAGRGAIPVVLVHGNCSSSLFFVDCMHELAQGGRYTIYAPDLRGYGDSDTLPVDATRGVSDFSDDLYAFAQALGLGTFHCLGWSLGGNVVMQYAIEHGETLRTMVLESPGSPFGFGGTRDAEGNAMWADFAGSGAGTVNADFVQRVGQGDRGNDATSPRTTINTFYFKPPFHVSPEREELYVTSLNKTKTGVENYPGDFTASTNWPMVVPGKTGVINALSPQYLHQSNLADIATKPPILWVHGSDDQIVADGSFFDMGYLGQIGLIPGWPGAEVFPAQPMKTQVRTLLNDYKTNGGTYQEHEFAECGHSPHIEHQEEFLLLLRAFIDAFETA